jgi:hypothetical protein
MKADSVARSPEAQQQAAQCTAFGYFAALLQSALLLAAGQYLAGFVGVLTALAGLRHCSDAVQGTAAEGYAEVANALVSCYGLIVRAIRPLQRRLPLDFGWLLVSV